jgi:hypothetical protein
MKKLLFLTVIVVFGLSKINAQDVSFGAKIGANVATLAGDTSSNFDPIVSVLNIGVYAEIPLNEKFSFQPELMYSTQGFSVNNNILALNYLNVPLIGKYYVSKGLSLEAGPQIGFLMSTKGEGEGLNDGFKTLDYGVNFGLGYKLESGLNFGA